MLKKINIKIIIFLYILFNGLVFTFLIPPFSKPDEPVHFLKTLEVKDGKIFCQNGQIYQAKNVNYFEPIFNLAGKYGLAGKSIFIFPINEYKKNQKIFIDKTNLKNEKKTTTYCHFNSLPYLIPAAVIYLGERFFLNPYLIFFLGRFFNFFIIFLIFYFFLKKSNQSWLFILPLMFPVTLQQLTAYSYDGATLIFLYLALFYYLKANENNLKEYLIFSIFLILGVLSKNYFYLPFILLLIKIFHFFKKIKLKQIVIKLLLITLMIIIIILLKNFSNFIQLNNFINEFKTNVQPINPKTQFYLIKKYPDYFIEVFFNNLLKKHDFYINSLIGNLEWLNFKLSPIIIYLFFILIFIKAKDEKIKIKNSDFILLLITSTIFFISILSYLYLTWTQVGYEEIEGFQGRYLIPIFPAILIIINQLYHKLKKFNLHIILFLIFISLLILYDFYQRHYDYSKQVKPLDAKITNKIFNISESYQLIVPVNKHSKINAFLISPAEKDPFPPMVILIYDQKCQKQIGKKIIPFNFLNKDEKMKYIFIKSIKTKNTDKLCIKFDFLNQNISNIKFNLLEDNEKHNKNIFLPVYSY